MHYAAMEGRVDLVEALLSAGAGGRGGFPARARILCVSLGSPGNPKTPKEAAFARDMFARMLSICVRNVSLISF